MVTVDGSSAFPLGFRRWEEGRPAPVHVHVPKDNSFTGQEARSSPPLVSIIVSLSTFVVRRPLIET